MKNHFSMRICFPGCEPHWFDNGYPCTIVSERSVQTHAARSLPIAQSDPERRYCFFFHRLRHHKFRFLRGSVEKAELMAGRKTQQGALANKKKKEKEKNPKRNETEDRKTEEINSFPFFCSPLGRGKETLKAIGCLF